MAYKIVVQNPRSDAFLENELEKVLRKVRTLQRRALQFTIWDRAGRQLSVSELEQLTEHRQKQQRLR